MLKKRSNCKKNWGTLHSLLGVGYVLDECTEARTGLRMAMGRFRFGYPWVSGPGSSGFGFGGSFSSTVFGFGAPKLIRFGFGFCFPPVDIQWISEINYLELKFIFYNMIIIIYLLRLLNLFKVNS